MDARDRASDRSRKKKSNFTGFLGTKLWKNQLISREFLGANFTKKQLVKNGQFSGYFQGKFHLKLIDFALIRPAFLTFLKQRSSFALSTTIRSRNEPMAKPLTSWLVPSFSQHNLRLVVSGRCLHVSVTKFQDKFASLRQVNSPYSWNKFQICCTDMCLIRFLLNFVDLPEFCGSVTAQNIRSRGGRL